MIDADKATAVTKDRIVVVCIQNVLIVIYIYELRYILLLLDSIKKSVKEEDKIISFHNFISIARSLWNTKSNALNPGRATIIALSKTSI